MMMMMMMPLRTTARKCCIDAKAMKKKSVEQIRCLVPYSCTRDPWTCFGLDMDPFFLS